MLNLLEQCVVELENGTATLTYFLTKDGQGYRPYGIHAEMALGGERRTQTASCRFATIGEAKAIAHMLCLETVTPTTLQDVI